MDYQKTYREKRVTPQEAVKAVKPGAWVDYGLCVIHPRVLDRELARRMEQDPSLRDVNFRGGIALWQPEVTKIPDAKERVTWNSWHSSGIERKLIDQGMGFYQPLRYSEMLRYYRENIRHVDVAMFQAAPMDRHGYFNFGISASHMSAVCQVADTIIVEVNPNMPVCLGGHEAGIHIDQVSMVVEGEGDPMAEMPSGEISKTDQMMAGRIVPEIRDGACLQLGIGGISNAVSQQIAQSDLKDLGVHTEMYVDGFVDIAAQGKVTGARKSLDRGRQVFTFAAGTKKLYDYVDRNPALMAAPVDYVNDIRVISSLDHFISVNNAVEVDLFGQVASESSGIRHISGAGGQLDFVLGAYLSRGGKSFICCASTFRGRDGERKSRILPYITPGGVVTATRANIQYLVTEYGLVNLKGTTTWQRAEKVISVAHPDFRDGLIAQAENMHIWRASNKR